VIYVEPIADLHAAVRTQTTLLCIDPADVSSGVLAGGGFAHRLVIPQVGTNGIAIVLRPLSVILAELVAVR